MLYRRNVVHLLKAGAVLELLKEARDSSHVGLHIWKDSLYTGSNLME